MSTAPSSLHELPATAPNVRRLAARVGERAVSTAEAAAFWAAIPLPMVVLAALLTGLVTAAPALVGALAVCNVVCAAVGHRHSTQ
ncbi:hypothetical protein [Haloarcula litorea]|uniref:hypothetical protein n=1 Tax=Haloarcula litorea TaxID=3032579 RepID=UPI0023E89733|nr:hypothetical protein [Halomicroarcula sp. GDY20]